MKKTQVQIAARSVMLLLYVWSHACAASSSANLQDSLVNDRGVGSAVQEPLPRDRGSTLRELKRMAAPTAADAELPEKTEDAGEFYRFSGRKLYLLRSLERVAVRHAPDQGQALRRRLEAKREAGQLLSVERDLPTERTMILGVRGISSLRELDRTIQQLGREPGVEAVTPVYLHQETGLKMIPTEEFVVKLAPGADLDSFEQMSGRLGVIIVERLGGTTDEYLLRLPGGAPADVLALCEAYWQDPLVEWAEPDFLGQFRRSFTPNDPFHAKQWNLAQIDLPQAWDTTTGSSEIVIAIVDDGIDPYHEDLTNNIFVNPGEIRANGTDDDGNGYRDDVNGWDFYHYDSDPSHAHVDDYHGTLVASVAAASGNNGLGITGSAYGCRIMPLKVAYGDWMKSAYTAEAIRYAAGFAQNGVDRWRGADVINLSIDFVPSNGIRDALQKARTQGRGGLGCPVFCAAGNSASGYQPYSIRVPAAWPADTFYLEFEYRKDASGVSGEDAVWIADVILPDSGGTRERFDSPAMPAGWSGDGDAGFTIVDDPSHAYGSGRYAARSGRIGDSRKSILRSRSFQLAPGKTLFFQAWVSSEKGNNPDPEYPPVSTDGDWLFVRFCRQATDQSAVLSMDAGTPGNRWVPSEKLVNPTIPFPASDPNTIAVGASTYWDYRADYSCYGASLNLLAPGGDGFTPPADFCQPIVTCDPTGSAGIASDSWVSDKNNYAYVTGTSFASPLAAGVAALMLSSNPRLTADRIQHIMQNTCDRYGSTPYTNGWNMYYGYGRVNAKKALEEVGRTDR